MTPSNDSSQNARPAGISLSGSYSPELESLRGWAILLVFVFHADGAVVGMDRIGTTVSPVLALLTAGHTGVTLFFVLSAVLLARPFLEEGAGGRRISRSNFFRRRFLRIMPLYSLAVVTAVFLSRANPDAIADGLRSLSFLSSFTGTAKSLMPYSAVWWSLVTEIQFYLVLPFLGLCLRSRSGRIVGLAALLAWAAAYAAVTTDFGLVSNGARFNLNLSLPGRAPAFLAGIAAAWIILKHGERIRAAALSSPWFRNGGSDVLLLACLFALGRVLQEVSFRGFIQSEISIPNWHVPESLLWAAIVLLVVLAPLRIRSVITNRTMAVIGTLSYSLYLIHVPIVFIGLGPLEARGIPVGDELGLRIVAFALVFALCVALSALTYRFIERPFLVRKARIDG